MKTAIALSLVGAGLVLGAVLAQEPGKGEMDPMEMLKPPAPVQDPKLDWFVGTWTGKTTFMGAEFDGTTTYEWALGHQWLMSTETYRGGPGPYESIGFFRPKDGAYQIAWFDNHGSTGTATGKWVGEEFHSSGKDAEMGDSRGVMKKLGADSMSWAFEADPDGDGKFDPMGMGTMRRTGKAAGASGTR